MKCADDLLGNAIDRNAFYKVARVFDHRLKLTVNEDAKADRRQGQ